MNNKKTMVLLALSTTIALTGCASESKKEVKQVKKFTKAEEAEFVKKFSELVLKPEAPAVILEQISKNIDKVSKQEASNMVDGLLYSMHQMNPDMNSKIQGLQKALSELDEKKIDFNNPGSIKALDDETTKAFLKEIQSKIFVVDKVGQDYLARPNVQFVIDTYGKYMNDDLKAMSEFSLEENQKPFFNKDTNSFDLNTVVDRILKVETNQKRFPDSFYKPAMENSKNYYYQIYFGTNNSFLVDKDKKVLPAVLTNYQDTVKKHEGSQLAKDIELVLQKLKATDNKVTDDVYVYLLEMTGTKTEDVKEEASETEKKATEKVNEAIQNAIKKNDGKEKGLTVTEDKDAVEAESAEKAVKDTADDKEVKTDEVKPVKSPKEEAKEEVKK